MGAKMISKGEMPAVFRALGRAHVKVMREFARRRLEGFAARHAQIALMSISQSGQGVDHCGEVIGGSQQQIDVDDGFGGESGNGGAADVVDGSGERAEGGGDAAAENCETLRPLRVVVFDNDGCCHSNCLRKAASCCWTSESSARRRETSASSWERRSWST